MHIRPTIIPAAPTVAPPTSIATVLVGRILVHFIIVLDPIIGTSSIFSITSMLVSVGVSIVQPIHDSASVDHL